jgi:hypothetical protein
MLPEGFGLAEFARWTTWLTVGVGLTVAVVVFVLLSWYRRRLAARAANEDLPWDQLLRFMRARHRKIARSGSLGDEQIAPENFLSLLLSTQPAKVGRRAEKTSSQGQLLVKEGIAERRSSRRRWGNPTEVYLDSPLLIGRVRGLVINRSTPGLAIFINQEVPPGSTLTLRAVEAPNSVPPLEVEVKYCRKTKRNYIIGCHAHKEIPWNVRGWLG